MGTSVSTLLVACKMQKKKKSTYMCVCVCDLWAYLFALKGLKASRITPRIRAYWSYRIRTASFLLVPTPEPGFVQDSGPQARAVSFFRAWGLRDRGMTVFYQKKHLTHLKSLELHLPQDARCTAMQLTSVSLVQNGSKRPSKRAGVAVRG